MEWLKSGIYNMKIIKLQGRIVSCIIAITIACEAIAYGQTPSRKPIPEDSLPIPDYYGLYAVTDKGLTELKKENNAPVPTIGKDMEFIYYDKDASSADSLQLYRLPPPNSQPKQPINNGSWNSFNQQMNENLANQQAAIEGLPRGSVQIEIRGKSITGKPEMVRLIPADFLQPGDYQIGIAGGPDIWYRFKVAGVYSVNVSTENQSAGNGASVAIPQTTPAIANTNDSVIAKGSGFEIKRSQLDAVMADIQSAAAARGQTISSEQLVPIEAQWLERLIHNQLLLQKATDDDKANGKQNADSQIDSRIDRAGSQAAFDQQLSTVGLTEDRLRSRLTEDAIAKAVLIRETGNTTSKSEIQKYLDNLEKQASVEILDPNLKQTPFEKLTASVPNVNLFTEHTREYAFSYDQVWGAVSKLIATQKEKIIQSDKDAGVLMTDVTSHAFLGLGFYDEYCMLIEKIDDNTTRVNFKLLRYELNPAGQKIPSHSDAVNSKAQDFLDKINGQLQTGK
jgi:hypothetical protein